MSVITESDIRKMLQTGSLNEKEDFFIDRHTILTPSAKSYLIEKDITMKYKDEESQNNAEKAVDSVYETLFGGILNTKPEHMTHLRGNVLVFKDHPRIALRGAIDSLESEIIQAQIVAERLSKPKITTDLEEIIRFIRKLLRCEITGEPVGAFLLQELNEHDLREQSYHPSKYFGVNHFLPTYKHGEMVAHLNKLRTLTRETELIAYDAFKDEYGGVCREDIIQAFNRLSSLFWIMMFKEISGKYE